MAGSGHSTPGRTLRLIDSSGMFARGGKGATQYAGIPGSRTLMSASTGGVSVAVGDVNGDGRGAAASNTYYVGSANGGVWKTTNGGTSAPAAPTAAQTQIIAILIG